MRTDVTDVSIVVLAGIWIATIWLACTPSTSAPVQPVPPEAGDCGVAQALTRDRMIRLPDGAAAVVPCP
jgi:hypothetical protein